MALQLAALPQVPGLKRACSLADLKAAVREASVLLSLIGCYELAGYRKGMCLLIIKSTANQRAVNHCDRLRAVNHCDRLFGGMRRWAVVAVPPFGAHCACPAALEAHLGKEPLGAAVRLRPRQITGSHRRHQRAPCDISWPSRVSGVPPFAGLH